jgi:carboxymethylenebutenolidase
VTSREVFREVPLDVAGDVTAQRAVIVVQEAFGVNDHIRDVTERFASQGYYAVAPELFHRQGSPEFAYDDMADALAAIGELNLEDITSDLDATSEYLHEAGFTPSSIAIVGYCMGGTISFLAATLGLVGAAATFYGGGIDNGRFGIAPLRDLAPRLRADWIGFYGDLDTGIPTEQVEALKVAAATSSHDTLIVRYRDAGHGFHCDARPDAYNVDAARDASGRALEFFATHLRDRQA